MEVYDYINNIVYIYIGSYTCSYVLITPTQIVTPVTFAVVPSPTQIVTPVTFAAVP